MRLFVALALPDAIADSLLILNGGIPGARWQTREQLHLTLRFIGETGGPEMAEIDDALSAISAPAFSLKLKGIDIFGGRKPHSLWAGVAETEAVGHLNRKIESALQRIGQTPDARKFSPHVTLARLKAPPRDRLQTYLAEHALFESSAFPVECFGLYSSILHEGGSRYSLEKSYPLSAA